MRPWLKPALRRAWRDSETVQFGVGPAHATTLRTTGPADAAFLDLLDGTRELPALTAAAAAAGVPAERVRRLLAELDSARALDDAAAQGALLALPPPERRRLAPDLAALSLAHPGPGAAPALLTRRRSAWVRVHGAGRVGAVLAAHLAAAGVGRVEVLDGGRVAAEDAAPGGVLAEDAGQSRAAAARRAVRRAAPARPAAPRPSGAPPDLVVVAPRGGPAGLAPDPELSRQLVQAGRPHLYAGVLETTGAVGPFVLPGETPCGRCVSLHRAERDPAWPRLLAQLCSGRAGPPAACDGTLAATVAGLAALHALLFLDGGSPPSLGASVEVSMADGEVRRRPLAAHPECGCHWAPARWPARPAPGGRGGPQPGGPAAVVRGGSAGHPPCEGMAPSGHTRAGEQNGSDGPFHRSRTGGRRRTTLELEEA